MQRRSFWFGGLPTWVVATIATATSLAQYDSPSPYGSSSPGLQAGGLAPPGAASPAPGSGYDPNPAPTEQTLREADEKDSGRGLQFVWLNGEGGFEIVGLQTLHANHLVDANIVDSRQSGPMFGAGLGARLIFLTLGARFRIGTLSTAQLWTLGAEAGLHIPIGIVEPHFNVGAGYASLGAFNPNDSTLDLKGAGVNIHGWYGRVGFGIDVYVTPVVSVGANMSGDVLFLTRPGVDATKLAGTTPPADQTASAQAASELYQADGSSVGAAAALTGVVGLHF